MLKTEGTIHTCPEDSSNSRLKISYAWPFKADYNIIEVDESYKFALVGEPTRTHCWIISRTPQLDESTTSRLMERMKALDFDTSRMHFDKSK